MAVYYKPQSPIQSGEDFIYPITTADQIMKSDNSRRLEQAGLIVADDSTNLGGIAASEYALKTKTVPTSRTINEKALSENITLSASDVSARPNTWMPSASDVGALEQNGTAANSSKLGGKAPEYYIQPRNLLDNSDFRNPVNQRGKTSYTAQGYIIDRWYSNNKNKTITLSNTGITLSTDSTLFQKLDLIDALAGKTITAAVCFADGTIAAKSGISTNNGAYTSIVDVTQNNLRIRVYEGTDGYIRFQFEANANMKLQWAALYEGSYTADTLPPYVPKGYAAELAECRRYFRRYTANNASLILNGLVTGGAKDVSVHAPELTPMRTKNVSIAYSGSGVIIRGVSGYATECSGSSIYGDISVSPYQKNSSFCASIDINKKDGTAWGLTNNTPVVVSFASNSTLDYIADL